MTTCVTRAGYRDLWPGSSEQADAAQTSSVAADDGCQWSVDGSRVDVGLVVPGLTCDRKFLAVTYQPSDDHGLPSLTSFWTAELTPNTEFDDCQAVTTERCGSQGSRQRRHSVRNGLRLGGPGSYGVPRYVKNGTSRRQDEERLFWNGSERVAVR